jgi:hypothetical protein
MTKLNLWWHQIWYGGSHEIRHARVTPPAWDPSATGDLWECSCGKVWAR